MRKIIALFPLILFACSGDVDNPKPHAYPRVYYPERNYVVFDTNVPYTFEYPGYAQMEPYIDDDTVKHPYWFNLQFKPFNVTLHLTYTRFKNDDEFMDLFNETRSLAYKHDIKAEEISPIEIQIPASNSTGIIYELKGNTATNLNFYISDSEKHFLRGALYFNSRTEIDSIEPILNFLKDDVIKMLETTRWKDLPKQ